MQREFSYEIGDTIHSVRVEQEDDHFIVFVGEQVLHISVRTGDLGRLDLAIDGRRLRAYAVEHDGQRYVALDGQTWIFRRPTGRRPQRSAAGTGSASLTATMPGRVLDVLVAAGDEVARGDTLVLLEAMKMELRVAAPAAGRVARVLCQAGEVVERGQLLVELEASMAEEAAKTSFS